MEVVLGALVSLVPKLAELLKSEYVKQKRLKSDIQCLYGELEFLSRFLTDGSNVPPNMHNEVAKLWFANMREVSYDIEDAIESFYMHAAGRKPDAVDHSIFKKIARTANIMKDFRSRNRTGNMVKEINNFIQELSNLWNKYKPINPAAVNPNVNKSKMDPRLRSMYKNKLEAEPIGIEVARDEVIRRLKVDGSDKSLKILSIVGFAGVGKTTLAKTVHERLKAQFDCNAFVAVGRRDPERTIILKNILDGLFSKGNNLQEVVKKKYSHVDTKEWKTELHEFLRDKSFFIVIDDIWDSGSWETILECLKLEDSNCGSRIIMTTRNSELVRKGEDVYRLQPLDDHYSKMLFNKRISSADGGCFVKQSDELCDNILRKCAGVPLAIIAIASLLAEKPEEEEWEKVYHSMVSGLGEDKTMEIISYSYEDLPPHLKPCLLYMSIFPEEFECSKYGLIWMWIGEGFVQTGEGGNLYEQGERYFNELCNRSMMEPLEDRTDCSILACRVHDVVYDLICNLSAKENFATFPVSEQDTSSNSLRNRPTNEMGLIRKKVRRLCLKNSCFEDIPHGTPGKPNAVRSLIIENCIIDKMPPLHIFLVCRVLCIEKSNIQSFKGLGQLQLLRYLAICYMHVENFPKEIADLKSLQALELLDIGPHELPPAVCALPTLMCMHITEFQRFPAERMGELESLEELELDPVVGKLETNDLVVQLGKLTRLKVVQIKFEEEMGESTQDALVKSLCRLKNIQDLKLSFPEPIKACAAWEDWVPPRKLWRLSIPDIMFSRLPSWIIPRDLPCLSNLAVFAYTVHEQDMENLASLRDLCYLHLPGPGIQHQGYTVDSSATGGGFKKLRFCNVNTAFKFLPGAMPNLEVLFFKVIMADQRGTFDGMEHEILATKDVIGDLDFGLANLVLLEQVVIQVDCQDARVSDVEEAEAVVRRAVEDHPKHPAPYVYRTNAYSMLPDSDEEDDFVESTSDLHLSDEEDVKQDEDFHVSAREMKDGTSDFDFDLLWTRGYQRLEKVTFHIDCEGASLTEVEELEAVFSAAVDDHPRRPTIQLIRENVDKMVSPSGQCNSEQGEDCDDEPVTLSPTVTQEQEIKSDETMHKPDQ